MHCHIQRITPFLWLDAQAEEAAIFYTSIFKDAAIVGITRYGEAGAQATGMPKGTVMTVSFELEGQYFMALNGGPQFNFTEAVSFMVSCNTQEEIDYYWERLSEDGDEKAQQCGWLKDKFGLWWQIVPTILGELLQDTDSDRSGLVMKAMLQMKKIDIHALNLAHGRT